MPGKLRSFIYYLLAVAAVVLVLKALNYLPFVFEKGTMRSYPSLEAAQAALNLKNVFIPAYYPQDISWPPSEVMAQTKPSPAVIMVCRRRTSGEIVLVISEAVSEDLPADPAVRIARPGETAPYKLKGRNATLEVGRCRTDEPCSRISWNEGDLRIAVSMRSAPFELIRIAESMVH